MGEHGRQAGLGTFAGVFTPAVLTILGLILFRRLGYVVGGGGVAGALGILLLAAAIALLTTISLAAIATNFRVKGGGDYYLISRSLGVEFGAAIGVVLYLAQSISIAFYCVGLGESLAEILPDAWFTDPRLMAAAAAVVLFVFAWAGADVATRLQYGIMAILGLAIASFFVGAAGLFSWETLAHNWLARPEGAPSLWTLFALFFPAITGFTQGVSMSGDLRDPQRSLPTGTFAAVGVAVGVYVGAIVAFGGAMPADELLRRYDAMARVSAVPGLVHAGVVAATLSSALASFLGAPRILQAMAGDRVFPVLDPFAKGHGPAGNPRRGTLLSGGIALACIGVGGIDVIAPVVSMFFLISYGLLNYATAFEARANSPSFRPRFRFFHYRASLAGAAGCFLAMVMISPAATAVAVVVVLAIHHYVDRLERPERWADAKRDHYFQRLRRNLLALAREEEHPRSWRPRILIFSEDAAHRARLLRFASWIEGDAGITSVVKLLEGRRERMPRRPEQERERLQQAVDAAGVAAFAFTVAAPDPAVAVQTVLQSHGLGPLRPNIALLGQLHAIGSEEDPGEHRRHVREFARQVRAITRIGVNVVVVETSEEDWEAVETRPSAERSIDVWWEDDESSRLMLLLAYMMTRTADWAEARLRVLTPATRRSARRKRVALEETLRSVRIEAEPEVMSSWSPEELVARSRDACVVFLPLRLERLAFKDPFGRPIDELLRALPLVAMVAAAEDVELDAEPDMPEVDEAEESPRD